MTTAVAVCVRRQIVQERKEARWAARSPQPRSNLRMIQGGKADVA